MAEKLLGRRLRDPRRRLGPRLPPPRERGGADARRARRAARAALGAQRDGPARRARRWPSRSATSSLLHEALDAYGRDALIMYFCGGHYRQPIEFDDERLERGRGARASGSARPARRLVAGPVARRGRRRCASAFFDALADDFNTPAALAAVFEWVREANRARRRRSGDADLREMLGVLGLENLLDVAERRGAAPRRSSCSSARERARAARDFAEADRLRDELRARGWEVRDGPDGPELLPLERRDRLRPQPGARGAPRAARRSRGSGRRENAAREPWLARLGVRCRSRRAEEIERRCGSDGPPGRLRRGRRRSATPTPASCWRAGRR